MIFRKVFVIVLFYGLHCFSLDLEPLFEAIEQGDLSTITKFFDKIDSVTEGEARELIFNFYNHYISLFGPEILDSEEYQEKLSECT